MIADGCWQPFFSPGQITPETMRLLIWSAGERLALSLAAMANHHFAKLADVWKHLLLVEILGHERPGRYWESHAGSGAYPMVDDSDRRFGTLGFCELVGNAGVLSESRSFHHLRSINGGDQLRIYPGGRRDGEDLASLVAVEALGHCRSTGRRALQRAARASHALECGHRRRERRCRMG
jgi:hypothetical protein